MQHPMLPKYYNSSWNLISQGAEARVWYVPDFIQYNNKTSSATATAICKERFPKSYRHPQLDKFLTRSRTRAECRSLTRCLSHGVSVPLVLAVDFPKTKNNLEEKISEGVYRRNSSIEMSQNSNGSCIFLEFLDGCTFRSFLSGQGSGLKDMETKKLKTSTTIKPCESTSPQERVGTTRVDDFTMKASYEVGIMIGKMHNANIVHGDLTTSNIFIRNPNDLPDPCQMVRFSATELNKMLTGFVPDIVLIDFGLSSISGSGRNSSNYEDRAVDLYVLERAFITTHLNSDVLVQEVLRGYKASCHKSDSVFVRLAQVRSRGRKRECIG